MSSDSQRAEDSANQPAAAVRAGFAEIRRDSSSPSASLNRRLLPDREIYFALNTVRIRIRELLRSVDMEWMDEKWLDEEIEVPLSDEESEEMMPVTRGVALCLAVAGNLFLRGTPSELLSEEPAIIDQMIRTFAEQLQNAGSLDTLVKAHPNWVGVFHPAAKTRERSTTTLPRLMTGDGVNGSMRDSNQGAKVDTLDGQPEHVKLAAIIGGMLRRIEEVTGEDRRILRREMAKWRKWQPNVLEGSAQDVPGLLGVYQSVEISVELLDRLMSSDSTVRTKAIREIESTGGFLNRGSIDGIEHMLSTGPFVSIRDNVGDDNVIAYCSATSKRECLMKDFTKMYGFDSDHSYRTIGDLPERNGAGQQVQFSNREHALLMFQRMSSGKLALSDEIAVRRWFHGEPGVATMAKRCVYQQLLDEGFTHILVRHFEIISVAKNDGNPQILPSAVNKRGRRYIESLAGLPVGSFEETVDIPGMGDDIYHVRVLWHCYQTDLEEALAWIDGLRDEESTETPVTH